MRDDMEMNDRVRDGNIERLISDGTVMVICPEIIFRKRKKNVSPIICGLISVDIQPFDLYDKYVQKKMEIDELEVGSPYRYYNDPVFYQLRNKISVRPTYWWRFDAQRGIKEDTLNFICKSAENAKSDAELASVLREFRNSHHDWGSVIGSQTISILRKYRIPNKLVDEMTLVKLYE